MKRITSASVPRPSIDILRTSKFTIALEEVLKEIRVAIPVLVPVMIILICFETLFAAAILMALSRPK